MTNRRQFVIMLSATSLAASATVTAQTKLEEKDPQAAALGYAADSTKVDSKKYPKYAKDQKCNNCQLYAGKVTDAAAACPIFAGKQVAGSGWCSAWVKKS